MGTDGLADVLREIEAQYDLGSGFLLGLYQEDDWSFVIKGHALIEAAVSQLLTHHIGDRRLSLVFERLELSNKQTGRLAFVRALDLLNDGERKFVRKLSELRNRLVHNVHYVRFRFADDFPAWDPNQRKAFVDSITYFAEPGTARESFRAEAEKDPKHVLWNAIVSLVLTCLNKTRKAKHRHDQIDWALDIFIDDLESYEDEQEDGDTTTGQ